MWEWLIQLVVLALALLTAGVRSLRFAPSEVTDFELERQVKRGVDKALAEQRLRAERPRLVALQRLVAAVLIVIIIAVLASVFAIIPTILLALVWLLAIEWLETRPTVRKTAEDLSSSQRERLYKIVGWLHVPLDFLADQQLFRQERRAVFYSKDELLQSIDETKTVLSQEEKTMLGQALRYENVQIKDVMTPRSVVVTVAEDETIGPILLDRLHQSGQSRFPVDKGDLDHVVGMLYMHDLVPHRPKNRLIRDAMSPQVFYVHEDKTLDHALHAFLRTKHHLFIVVNEFEETTGVISIEDILETIIGRKIVDEFDQYEDLRAVARLAAAKRQKSKTGEHV